MRLFQNPGFANLRTRGCVKKKLETGVLSQLRISKTPGSLSLRKPLQTPGSNFSCDKTPGSSFYKPRVQTSPVTKPRVQVSPTDDRAERSEAAEARARALQRAPREVAPSLQSTLFIAAPQGHSGRNHSLWSARVATRHSRERPNAGAESSSRHSLRPILLPPACDA